MINCPSCRNRNGFGGDVRGSPGWRPWHCIPLAASFRSLLVSSSGQRALAPGRCTDGKVPRSGHSWVEISLLGAKSQPSWNNDSQPDGNGKREAEPSFGFEGKRCSPILGGFWEGWGEVDNQRALEERCGFPGLKGRGRGDTGWGWSTEVLAPASCLPGNHWNAPFSAVQPRRFTGTVHMLHPSAPRSIHRCSVGRKN